MTSSQVLAAAIRALLEAIEHDAHRGGGLLSCETLDKAVEVRIALSRALKREREEALAG
jgi:hypothetical protein